MFTKGPIAKSFLFSVVWFALVMIIGFVMMLTFHWVEHIFGDVGIWVIIVVLLLGIFASQWRQHYIALRKKAEGKS